jgi:hypothetical protein
MKEEAFRVLLVMDEYTLHASNISKWVLFQVSQITMFPGVLWDSFILSLAPYK